MVRKRERLFLLIAIFSLAIGVSFAQQSGESPSLMLKGMPEITPFSREDFKADPQFWTVCEDKEGTLYFGNNDGALIFNGEQWQKVSLPNNSSVRSLACDSAGNVFAGGFNEIGLIKKDKFGRYYYKSLLDTLQLNGDNFENLWKAYTIGDYVIFRSFGSLFVISDQNKVTKLPATNSFIGSYKVNEQFLVYDQSIGILSLDLKKMQFDKLFAAEDFGKEEIVDLLPGSTSHEMLGVGKSGRIFLFNLVNRKVRYLQNVFPEEGKDQVISALKSQDGQYLLGTLSSKIVTLDVNYKPSAKDKKFHELQDKTVLALYQSQKGNIWALLNNGLDCINFNSPVSSLLENASVFDLLLNKERMYVATNQGVFYADSIRNGMNLSPEKFKKISNLEGQAWSVQEIEGDVLVSHDKGLFQINGIKSAPIGNLYGIWKVIPVKGKKGFYFASHYHGLYLLSRSPSGTWRVEHKVKGFDESSRDIMAAETPGTYWVCHGFKGVFRIKINDELSRITSLEHFTTQNGFTSPFNINVFEWEGETIFTSNHGIHSFHSEKSEFVPFKPLNSLLDSTLNTRKIFQSGKKTWFVQDDEVGYFTTQQASPSLHKEPFLQFKGNFNRGMECIVPIDSSQVLLGTKTGLYLVNLAETSEKEPVPTFITSVQYATNQEATFLPVAPGNRSPANLPNNTPLLRFEFAAPGMENNSEIQYSYKLEHVDEAWSPWQKDSFKEYSYLRPGRYTFKIKSRNLSGALGEGAAYHFQILPVWHQTSLAWALYFILAVLFIAIVIFFIRRKFKNENLKARKEEEKARKLLELEIQQMRLQTEKEKISQEKDLLEEDVITKSKELANYTMLLVKKREVLFDLQQNLKDLREVSKNESSKKKVREAIKKINDHIADEEHLQVFQLNFEKVHHDFFTRLKELFPDLNQRELQLCAFVKMNLSNKEISPLLNISVRGVETARYRLRKKLNLEHDHNLVEFLENINKETKEEVS